VSEPVSERIRRVVARFWLRIAWSVGGLDDVGDGLPRITSDDVRPILARMVPGDVVLMGNNGLLSHVAVYAGDGRIVHAMATGKTMRGWIRAVLDAFVRLVRWKEEDHVGVLEEPLTSFVDRFERDTIVVVRHRGMTEDGIRRGIAHLRTLLGRPYDYLFARRDEAFYCTELVEELWEEGIGPTFTRIQGRRARVPLLLDREVIEPAAILHHPDVDVVVANEAARVRYADLLGRALVFPRPTTKAAPPREGGRRRNGPGMRIPTSGEDRSP
jgi:hypothetical protein